MPSKDLKPEQVRELLAILARHQKFYFRLVKRIERLKWPVADPVYQRAINAEAGVAALQAGVEQIQAKTGQPSRIGFNYLDDAEIAPGRRRARLQ